MVQQWMEKHYCEGEINDILSKQELWLSFKDFNQLQDRERSVFFSHLGNMIRRAPFEKVKPVKSKHKQHSGLQFFKTKQQPRKFSLSLVKNDQSADKEAVSDDRTNSTQGESKSETEGSIVDKQIFGPDGPVANNGGTLRVVEQSSDKKLQCSPSSHTMTLEDSNDDIDKSPGKIPPTIPESPIPIEGETVSEIDEHDSQTLSKMIPGMTYLK